MEGIKMKGTYREIAEENLRKKRALEIWGNQLAHGVICVLCDRPIDERGMEYNDVMLCSERCRADYIRLIRKGVLRPRNQEVANDAGLVVGPLPGVDGTPEPYHTGGEG
jgi:hypothetical protein